MLDDSWLVRFEVSGGLTSLEVVTLLDFVTCPGGLSLTLPVGWARLSSLVSGVVGDLDVIQDLGR